MKSNFFAKGIEVLCPFFIDQVMKCRDYSTEDQKNEYTRAFEEEYEALKAEHLGERTLEDEAYRKHRKDIAVGTTHNGVHAKFLGYATAIRWAFYMTTL